MRQAKNVRLFEWVIVRAEHALVPLFYFSRKQEGARFAGNRNYQ
jgi:hypothetical protein